MIPRGKFTERGNPRGVVFASFNAGTHVGLLAEQYDRCGSSERFPQAFSHVGLINTAPNLARHGGPAEDRQRAATRGDGSCQTVRWNQSPPSRNLAMS